MNGIAGAIIVMGAIMFASFSTYIEATKVECREGYVPVFVAYSGWRCFAGYKP
jgi:hypothetical protein